MDNNLREKLIIYQKNEITEYHIYSRLADNLKSEENTQVLREIAEEELAHYEKWKKYTKREIKPSKWRILKRFLEMACISLGIAAVSFFLGLAIRAFLGVEI